MSFKTTRQLLSRNQIIHVSKTFKSSEFIEVAISLGSGSTRMNPTGRVAYLFWSWGGSFAKIGSKLRNVCTSQRSKMKSWGRNPQALFFSFPDITSFARCSPKAEKKKKTSRGKKKSAQRSPKPGKKTWSGKKKNFRVQIFFALRALFFLQDYPDIKSLR